MGHLKKLGDDENSQNIPSPNGGIQGIDNQPRQRHTANRSRRNPSMDAKAGWLKFLASAAAVGYSLKNKIPSNNTHEMDGIPEEKQNHEHDQELNGNENIKKKNHSIYPNNYH